MKFLLPGRIWVRGGNFYHSKNKVIFLHTRNYRLKHCKHDTWHSACHILALNQAMLTVGVMSIAVSSGNRGRLLEMVMVLVTLVHGLPVSGWAPGLDGPEGVVVLKNNSDITAYLGLRSHQVLCGIFQKTLLPLTSTCSLIQCSSEPLILMEVCAFFQVCRCQLEVWELQIPLIYLPYLRLRQLTLGLRSKLIAGTEPRPSATQ